MWGAVFIRRSREPHVARLIGDLIGSGSEGRRDGVDFPGQNLAQGGRGHGGQDKVAGFAAVKPQGAGLIGVAVVHQAGEIFRPFPVEPVLLKGNTLLPARGDVAETVAVGPQKPFVCGGDQEIRLNRIHAEGHGAQRLGAVHHQRRPHFTAAAPHRHQIDQRAVRPVAMRQGGDGRIPADGLEKGRRPVVVRGMGDRCQPGTRIQRPPPPCIDIGGELVLQHDDLLTGCHGDVPGRQGDAIGY